MEPATALLLATSASSAASMYNNAQNIKYAGRVNDDSVELANTAHQREIRDLLAAGLNPVLSAQSNGAAVPSLQTPSLESIDGGLSHNATAISRAISGDMKAERELRISQKGVNTAQAFNLEQDGILKRAQAELITQGMSSAKGLKDHIESFGSWAGEKYQQFRDSFNKRTTIRTRPWVFTDGDGNKHNKYGKPVFNMSPVEVIGW